MRRKTMGLAVAWSLVLGVVLAAPAAGGPIRELRDPQTAPGEVQVCEGSSACTRVEAVSCPTTGCPHVPVTVRLSSFPAGATAHVYWVYAEMPSELRYDCTHEVQATKPTRVELGQITLAANGTGSLDLTVPTAARFPSAPPEVAGVAVIYGTHWVCATTVSAGSGGIIGEQAVVVVPGQ